MSGASRAGRAAAGLVAVFLLVVFAAGARLLAPNPLPLTLDPRGGGFVVSCVEGACAREVSLSWLAMHVALLAGALCAGWGAYRGRARPLAWAASCLPPWWAAVVAGHLAARARYDLGGGPDLGWWAMAVAQLMFRRGPRRRAPPRRAGHRAGRACCGVSVRASPAATPRPPSP